MIHSDAETAVGKTVLCAGGKWKVWVTTNELPSAGTQAQVTLTVYGHRGCTKPLPLGSPDGRIFQAGNVDQFTVCAIHSYIHLFESGNLAIDMTENKGNA